MRRSSLERRGDEEDFGDPGKQVTDQLHFQMYVMSKPNIIIYISSHSVGPHLCKCILSICGAVG
jgi:hypothetical protein